MRLYQLGEFEAKKNKPKSKILFGCWENNRKTQGRKREKEKEPVRRWEPVFRSREMWAMKESGSESERDYLNVWFPTFYNRWYKI